MIPVKLTLKNFLSYGENVAPLDFTEFHVACLSGNNGHGKSALLDAITWALWGEARKGPGQKKPDEGLVRLGTTDMEVEFEFDLEGARYRVIRKFSKTKKSKPILELQLLNGATGNFIPIGGSKIGETQEKIRKLLGMSYDTFINSAFILQGRADEFIQKGATDRKAIFTEILGLSRYDELAKLAKSHAEEAKKFCEQQQKILEDIDKELAQKEIYRSQIEDLELILTTLSRQIEENSKKLEALKEEKNLLNGKKHTLTDLNLQVQQINSDLKMLVKQIQHQQEQVTAYERVIQRKEEILENYQKYHELCLQEEICTEKWKQLRNLESERSVLEKAIQQAQHELEKRKERWETNLAQIQSRIQEAELILNKSREIEQGYKDLQEIRKREEIWEEKRNQLEELERKAWDLEHQIETIKTQLQAEIQALNQQAKELRGKVSQEFRQKARLDQLQTLKSELETLEKDKEQIVERGNQLKVSLENLKNQLNILVQEKIPELFSKLSILQRDTQARCPVCESDLTEGKRAVLEARLIDELSKAQSKKEELERQIIREEAELSKLRLQYEEMKKKLQDLPKVQQDLARVEADYQEILLSKGKLLELGGRIEGLKERIQKGNYASEIQAALKLLKEDIKVLGYSKEEHQAIKQKVKDLSHFELDKDRLETTRIQHQKLYETLPAIQEEISKISERLQNRDYAVSEQIQLRELQAKIQSLGYDEETHRKIKEELQKLYPTLGERDQLAQAEEKINLVREALQRSEETRMAKENLQKDLLQKIEELQQDLKRLPKLEEEIQTQENRLKTWEKDRDQRLEERGVLQSKYRHCLELEEKRQEVAVQWQAAHKDQFIYEKLTTAFGKDGIQALIIENAIPELEDEANAILSQLTDHRAHITIESLRDKKSGGIKETLDIKVSDELGTRDLELYSGGESFRTNFALRIALSKLLAKRAGTKLRTLFIDEGFGTQDAQGLEQLIEAIRAIQDDFDKILIITHLDTLKNAFPVRIEVTKFPDIGSSYQIIR
jgi:exonuclease SbcC